MSGFWWNGSFRKNVSMVLVCGMIMSLLSITGMGRIQAEALDSGSVTESVYALAPNGSKMEIGDINPAPVVPFPGGKAALYTWEYGASVTLKDASDRDAQYGVGIVVESGNIVKVYDGANGKIYDSANPGGAAGSVVYGQNIAIPENGYVLFAPNGSAERAVALSSFRVAGGATSLTGYSVPNKPDAESPYAVISENGTRIAVNGQNIDRADNSIVVYTALRGLHTGTADGGVEVVVTNGQVSSIVTGGANNSRIPVNGYVISAQGTKAQLLTDSFEIGNEVATAGVTLPPNRAVIVNGTTRILINGVNANRDANTIIMYTPDWGTSTATGNYGVEVVVSDGVVTEIVNGLTGDNKNNALIPARGYVLSGIDASGSFTLRNLLNGLKAGDTIELENIILDPRKTEKKTADAVDPTAETHPAGEGFPGFRGANQLIVYTKQFGARTGTNVYGTDITVRNGFVTKKGGYDSEIPEDGYVISGHGVARDWLNANVVVGAKVTVDHATKEVSIIVDGEVYLRYAELAYAEAKSSFDLAVEQLREISVDEAAALLETARLEIEDAQQLMETDVLSAINLAKEAKTTSEQAFYRTLESFHVEGRGVWHRPTEKTREDVGKTLDLFQSMNLNMVFLETFYHGYVIYPSEIADQRPEFSGLDLLGWFVEEAELRGMEVHPWVENFYVGNTAFTPQSPILEKHPEWEALRTNLTRPSAREAGYIFMNPAHPEVRDFLVSLYEEMITKYDVRGLQLDYIRYPVGTFGDDYGYDDYSRAEFERLHGMDPLDIPSASHELWPVWNKWRQNNITTFVERVREELLDIRPSLAISTAIFPQTEEAIKTKMQDWPLWVDKGYLDIIAPMAYYTSVEPLMDDVSYMVGLMENKTVNYAGIAPYLKLLPKDIVDQVAGVREAGAQGVIMFDSKSFSADMVAALQAGPFRTPAIVPDADVSQSVQTLLDGIMRKANEIYVPNHALTETELTRLKSEVDAIAAMTAFDNAEDGKKVRLRIHQLQEKLGSIVANGKATDRIHEDLSRAQYLVQYVLASEYGLDMTVPPASGEGNGEGNGDWSGNVPVVPSKPEHEYTLSELNNQVKDGKLVLQVEKEVLLPLQLDSLSINGGVEFVQDGITVNIPLDVLKAAGQLAPDSKPDDGTRIVVRIVPAAEEDTEQLVDQISSHTGMKPAGKLVELQLGIVGKDGQFSALESFEKPVVLGLPVDENANAKRVGIYYLNGEGDAEYMGGRMVDGVIQAELNHFSQYAVLEWNKQYQDVPASHWAHSVIGDLTAKHIVNGVSESRFAPERLLTRAEFAALLTRAAGLPASDGNAFVDVSDDAWYAGELNAAYEAGIIDGIGQGLFAPEREVTREEMVVMAMRMLQLLDINESPSSEERAEFADLDQASAWAAPFVKEARQLGLIQGFDGNVFKPGNQASRAQSAQLLHRILEQIGLL